MLEPFHPLDTRKQTSTEHLQKQVFLTAAKTANGLIISTALNILASKRTLMWPAGSATFYRKRNIFPRLWDLKTTSLVRCRIIRNKKCKFILIFSCRKKKCAPDEMSSWEKIIAYKNDGKAEKPCKFRQMQGNSEKCGSFICYWRALKSEVKQREECRGNQASSSLHQLFRIFIIKIMIILPKPSCSLFTLDQASFSLHKFVIN